MMTVIFRVILVIVSILTMAFMMRKIRQAKVQIEAALFWVIMALILVVFSLFPAVADACAHLLGIYSTPNFLFLFMIFLLIVKVFGMTLQMSQMESRQKELVQRIALDQKDREELELKIQRFLEKEESAGKDSREVMSTKKMAGEETDGRSESGEDTGERQTGTQARCRVGEDAERTFPLCLADRLFQRSCPWTVAYDGCQGRCP